MPFIYEIDSLDKAILNKLIENGKTPFTEIAERLNVSHGTIHQRVKKLEKRGIIKKNSIVVDYDKLGYGFIFFLGIIVGSTSDIDKLSSQLKQIPEITVAHITSGKFNMLCKIRTTDSKDAAKIIQKIQALEGVMRTESTVSFSEFINSKEQLVKQMISKSIK